MGICEPHRKTSHATLVLLLRARCLEMGIHITIYTFIKIFTFCIALVQKLCCGEILDVDATFHQLTHLRIRITAKATSRILDIYHANIETHTNLSNSLPNIRILIE
jgi:hypothetical protein